MLHLLASKLSWHSPCNSALMAAMNMIMIIMKVDLLAQEFKNFQTFSKLLRVGDKRANLHQVFIKLKEDVYILGKRERQTL